MVCADYYCIYIITWQIKCDHTLPGGMSDNVIANRLCFTRAGEEVVAGQDIDLSLKTWHWYSFMDFPTVNDIVCPHITKGSWCNCVSFRVWFCLFFCLLIQCVFLSLKVIHSFKCTDERKGMLPAFLFLYNCLFKFRRNTIISIINIRERHQRHVHCQHSVNNLPLLFKVELF